MVEEGDRAKTELEKVGIKVTKINDVIIQKLRQDRAGQLGMFCRKMAETNVNILVQYSGHPNQLIVGVDDYEKGKKVSGEWTKEWRIKPQNEKYEQTASLQPNGKMDR